jgi:hypothetical protein
VAAVVPAHAAPEAAVHVPDAQVAMHVDGPAVKVDRPVRKTNTMMDARHMGTVRDADAVHTTAANAGTTTAAAMRTRISTGGSESRDADNGRSDEGEESRTFEHCRRPSWLDVGHPNHWSGQRGRRFKRLIFSIFSFI